MATDSIGSVGILWREERGANEQTAAKDRGRLQPIFDSLAALNVAAEPVVFSDDRVDEARDQLLHLDGVLVWVDPIMGDTDRSRLDALLREVASAGVWVSADPDVILKMGTKEVLFRTRELGWGGDVHLYETMAQFKSEFPARLATAGPRVVKQNRGNGGIGVWKVELTPSARASGVDARMLADATVRVQDAAPRDTVTEELRLGEFMERCADYLAGAGCIVDQPFQPRIAEGMIRCYMVRNEVVGFAHQWPEGLNSEARTAPEAPVPQASDALLRSRQDVLGLPSKKTMYAVSESRFATLRARMESEWIPGLQRLADVDADALPLLWDADFLYGPKTPAGGDTYVLCEINISSVSPFPEQAVGKLAQAVVARLTSKKNIIR